MIDTATRPPTVVVVGSAHIDIVALADRLPVRGETLPGRRLTIHPGGKGLNQAVQVAQAGARSVMLGRVGRDEFGHRLRAALTAKGVVVDWLAEDELIGTGASTVIAGTDGDYVSVIVPGAGMSMTAESIADGRDAFDGSSVVVAQLELAMEPVRAAFEWGRRAGALTILNAAPAPERVDTLVAVLPLVDLLVVNQMEAAMLVGRQPRSLVEAGEALQGFCSIHDIGTAVLTAGSLGAIVIGPDGRDHLRSHQVQVVDAIGAGDAFVGTMAASLARGDRFLTAARRGNAAGALAVTRSGAYDGLPTAAAVDELLRSSTG